MVMGTLQQWGMNMLRNLCRQGRASIPVEHREEACYRFISSGIKLEQTVAWMMKEYADTISRAKYPEKLCINTVTMGGNGKEQQLNVAASGNAYRRYASEAQLSEEAKAKVFKMLSGNQTLLKRLECILRV